MAHPPGEFDQDPIVNYQGMNLDELIAAWQLGDQEAAGEIFARFSKQLLPVVRRKLHPRLLSKIDPEDIVQSVYRTVVRRQKEGTIDLHGAPELAALLMTIAVRKCIDKARYYFSQQRDPRREVPLDVASHEHAHIRAFLSGASASDLEDSVDECLQRLRNELDPNTWNVLELRLQGLSTSAIANRLGCSVRTVQLRLALVRRHLEEMRSQQREG